MKHIFALLIFAAVLPLNIAAQEAENTNIEQSSKNSGGDSSGKILTGFSGGLAVHGGYLFAKSPDEMFRNGSLREGIKAMHELPSDGFTMGVSAALRLHLINHIHLGAEGGVSTMPVMKSGSQIRTGWGGAFCDLYWRLGKVVPLFGITVGGGSTNRLYIPSDAEEVSSENSTTTYNASYTKTPFFLLDPYIGMEILLSSHIALTLKVDYMLPFGKNDNGVSMSESVKWDNFVRPSGPKLHIGVMFGKQK